MLQFQNRCSLGGWRYFARVRIPLVGDAMQAGLVVSFQVITRQLPIFFYCRRVINKLPPFKGLYIKIPMILPIRGRGCVNHGSTLQFAAESNPVFRSMFACLWILRVSDARH